MTNLVREKASEIKAAIDQATRVLLHCHPSPDPDSLGSALAFYHMLKHWGKAVTVIKGDWELPPEFSAFPGFDEIERKNYLEVDVGQYDLFLIVDSGAIGQISKQGPVIFPSTLRTVVIDHHSTNQGYGEVNLVDTSYPATAQIIFDLFKIWQINIDHDMALCLLLGIYGDTGGFRYDKTTAETFGAAAELVAVAPDYPQAVFMIENSNAPETLAYEALALNNISTHFNNAVAVIALSQEALSSHGIRLEQVGGVSLSRKLISVKGWQIGASLIEKEPNRVMVSLRSRDPERYDVSKVAQSLGGGGHKVAAGALIEKPLSEAKEALLAAVADSVKI